MNFHLNLGFANSIYVYTLKSLWKISMTVSILSSTLLLKKVQSCHQFLCGFQHGESKNGSETRMKVIILLIGLAFLPPLTSGIRKFISIHVLLTRYLKIGFFMLLEPPPLFSLRNPNITIVFYGNKIYMLYPR